ncbi:lysosomal Pro-X carboxypeptidase [Tanacetum coccineum]
MSIVCLNIPDKYLAAGQFYPRRDNMNVEAAVAYILGVAIDEEYGEGKDTVYWVLSNVNDQENILKLLDLNLNGEKTIWVKCSKVLASKEKGGLADWSPVIVINRYQAPQIAAGQSGCVVYVPTLTCAPGAHLYPHIALGALASLGPILYFNNLTPQDGYYSIEASLNCYNTIRDSWKEIDRVFARLEGLALLSQKFKTCSQLNGSSKLKNYLDSMYAGAAQYNAPPKYPTTRICDAIDASDSLDILDHIFASVVAYQPNKTCYNMTSKVSQTSIGWQWQVCSEMVIPIGITSNISMFPSSPYDAQKFIDECKKMYGVTPRAHWATTYYGGHVSII